MEVSNVLAVAEILKQAPLKSYSKSDAGYC